GSIGLSLTNNQADPLGPTPEGSVTPECRPEDVAPTGARRLLAELAHEGVGRRVRARDPAPARILPRPPATPLPAPPSRRNETSHQAPCAPPGESLSPCGLEP